MYNNGPKTCFASLPVYLCAYQLVPAAEDRVSYRKLVHALQPPTPDSRVRYTSIFVRGFEQAFHRLTCSAGLKMSIHAQFLSRRFWPVKYRSDCFGVRSGFISIGLCVQDYKHTTSVIHPDTQTDRILTSW